MKMCFVNIEYDNVICISEIISYFQNLFYPVVEISEVEIGKILWQVVSDRYARCRIYNIIKQWKEAYIFDFPSDYFF